MQLVRFKLSRKVIPIVEGREKRLNLKNSNK